MGIRVKAKWKDKDRQRSYGDIGSALAFNAWKAAAQVVLNLENEGFQTETNAQRLDVIAEILAFLIQVADRMAYERMDDEARAGFVSAFATKLAAYMADNRRDVQGPGEWKSQFIDLINDRAQEYAECHWSQADGASFKFRRLLGERVALVMGEKDKRWIPDYIIDREAPEAVRILKRAMPTLLGD
jgi:hypothetical protein